ncbi:MAG: DNA polymerase III subunit beta, partial [Candidatus Aureabacteria bacterium]|nr:DNA polymerase III subunit beta [Candidatus Auribacterota bacterium]
ELWISASFPAKVKVPGAATIPGRHFMSIIRELPGQEVDLSTGEDNITRIKCQKAYFQVMGLAREDFPAQPELKDAENVTIKQRDLKLILHRTAYACAQDPSRQQLNGVCMLFEPGKLTAVSTDGRRLAMALAEAEVAAGVKKEIILPLKAVLELQRILGDDGDVLLKVGSRQIGFQLPRVLFIARLLEGRYPNWQQVIPPNTKEKISLPREEFLQVVRRMSLLTSEKSNSVKLAFKPGGVKVSSGSPEVGESREEMALDYQGGEIELTFNPLFVTDVLKALEDEQVFLELVDGSSPGLFRIDGQFLCVIMPMKIT